MMMLPRPLRACLLFAVAAAVPVCHAQVTESPHTVAPGSLLIEMDGLRVALDRADPAGNLYSAVAVASTLLTAGLTSEVDLQVGLDVFHRETYRIGGARDRHSGLGDLSFRAKWTFWRNERGAALAVIPYVKVPTVRDGVGNNSVEGGFIVPWATPLPGGANAGAMFTWDVIRNPADTAYRSKWLLSAFVQQPLTLGFSAYAETTFAVEASGWGTRAGSVGVGMLWRWSERLLLDYELLRGLDARAGDWTHVLRINWGW